MKLGCVVDFSEELEQAHWHAFCFLSVGSLKILNGSYLLFRHSVYNAIDVKNNKTDASEDGPSI